ncbi:hypothetical protein [Marimonas arenosa]|uniref:EF-hand domain-containing protein n=1 Tax=Marimonas arenosa TaxID=1795305 RepID=A0AAE4B5E9_9RHOB|nr:hypothetical protein [Marimonas arenosa]MDQ2091072.1 hypothetical protein [Marimonas arenosa]
MTPVLRCLALALAVLVPGLGRADTGIEIFNRITKQKFFQNELQRILSDPEAAKRRYLGVAFRVEHDGHVSRIAVERRFRFEDAQWRAREVSKMLNYDLDGDGAVSVEDMKEMEQILPSNNAARIRARHFAADRDGNGTVTVPEILSGLGEKPAEVGGLRNSNEITVILGMDLDGDGVTTPDEIIAAIDLLRDAAKR